ncbi:MAG: hypothetical protein AB1894_17055 [Chloroflexota bacterium]
MPTLSEDLEHYWDEAYTHKDIIAGLKLLAEFAGLVGLGITAGIGGAWALSLILGPFGIPVSAGAVYHGIVKPILEWYSKLETEERFYVRAAVNAFNPAQHLQIAGEAIDHVDEVAVLIDILRKALDVHKIAGRSASALDTAAKAAKAVFKRKK